MVDENVAGRDAVHLPPPSGEHRLGDFDFELLSPNKAPPPPKAKPEGKSEAKSSAVPDKSKDTAGEKKAPK